MMAVTEIVRELPLTPSGAQQVLVKRDEHYFIVSSVVVYSGPETLVFPADESGEVTAWGEVAGGRYVSREQAIAELADYSDEELAERLKVWDPEDGE